MIKQAFASQFEAISQFGGFQVNYCPGSAFESFVTILLGFLTVIGGLMFLVYFVLGGLSWISSRGEKEMVAKAQRYMSNALIGLIVVVLAWAFTGIVGAALGFNILDLANNIGPCEEI